ncbi:MAG TPA: PorP/SprF family type IX secretion system membrane protein [Cyclobacteriaceae bacterium]
MKLTKALLFLIIQNMAVVAYGQLNQQNLIYNNYFLNPYLYNPSIIAASGYTELALNYRQQWSGFAGGLKTSTLNLQIPLNYKVAVGVNLYNDQAGVLQTNTGLLSFAYQVYLGQNINIPHKLSFGLSAGMTNSSVSRTNIPSGISDPAIVTSNLSNIDGQFGLGYQFHNFKLGFSLPRLFKSQVIAEGSYKVAGLDPMRSTISTVSYKFQLSPRISFEPIAMYRTEVNLHWFEGLGVLKIDNIGWIGGSYRQNYGPAAFLGFNIKDKLKVGYAYEFAAGPVNGFGNGSHEVQLILRVGKNKKERPKPKEKETKGEEEPQDQAHDVAEVTKEETQPKKETEPTDINKPQVNEPVKEEAKVAVVEQPQQNQPADQQVKDQQPKTETTKTEVNKVVEKPVTESPDNKETAPKKPTQLNGNTMTPGHYVVVGAFQSSINAKNYAALLKRSGYPADVAFDPNKKYYFVHMGNVTDLDEAKRLRDVYRQKSRYSFKETWILSIE